MNRSPGGLGCYCAIRRGGLMKIQRKLALPLSFFSKRTTSPCVPRNCRPPTANCGLNYLTSFGDPVPIVIGRGVLLMKIQRKLALPLSFLPNVQPVLASPRNCQLRTGLPHFVRWSGPDSYREGRVAQENIQGSVALSVPNLLEFGICVLEFVLAPGLQTKFDVFALNPGLLHFVCTLCKQKIHPPRRMDFHGRDDWIRSEFKLCWKPVIYLYFFSKGRRLGHI